MLIEKEQGAEGLVLGAGRDVAGHLRENDAQQASGTLEISAMQAPMTVFVWSKSRIAPVRITDDPEP